jgi:hypothetical protein
MKIFIIVRNVVSKGLEIALVAVNIILEFEKVVMMAKYSVRKSALMSITQKFIFTKKGK